MRTHLNNLVIAELIIVHIVVGFLVVLAGTANVVHVELLEDLRDDKIENRNDIGRVVFDLPIQHLIELEDMIAVDFKDVSIELADLLEFLDIVWRLLILLIVILIIIVLDLLKVVDEVFEFHLDFRGIDICAPKHHCMRAHLTISAHATLQELLALVVHHAC